MDLFDHKKSKIRNIFSNKRGSKSGMEDSPGRADQSGHTLDRIINAKEEARRLWDEQRESFERSRRDHEVKMIDMEKAEVVRREKAIREQEDALDDQRRKNKLVQEKFIDQIRSLQEKLEEYKLSHKEEEGKMVDELAAERDKLLEVKNTLEKRVLNVESMGPFNPTAPPPDSIYPDMSQSLDNVDGASPLMVRSTRSASPGECSA